MLIGPVARDHQRLDRLSRAQRQDHVAHEPDARGVEDRRVAERPDGLQDPLQRTARSQSASAAKKTIGISHTSFAVREHRDPELADVDAAHAEPERRPPR